jgi:uncharacterized protein (DUF58 family)
MKWIVGAGCLIVAALALQLQLLALATAILVGTWMVTRQITAQWTQALVGQRIVTAETCEVGDTVVVQVIVRNTGRTPILWVLLEDLSPTPSAARQQTGLHIRGKRLGVETLRGGQELKWTYQIDCRCRGYYQLGPLVAETGDIFGLNRRFRVLCEPHYLLVLPTPRLLDSFDIASRRPIGEVILSHRLFEDPTRIVGVREYQTGDSFRRIHWRATARTGRLHSKIFEPSSLAGATLVVDFHDACYESGDEPLRSELTVTAAASVAMALFELGQQVGLLSNGRDAIDRIQAEGWRGDSRTRQETLTRSLMHASSTRLRPVVVRTSKSPNRLDQILHSLARLEKTNGLSLTDLLLSYSSELPRDATIMVFLARVDLMTAALLGQLKRQGFAVMVVVNCYEAEAYARSAGPLINEGIQVAWLKDERSIQSLCARQTIRV